MQALIVDASRTMRRILCQIVEPLGFLVSEAETEYEALQSLSQIPGIGLVLVNWNMPEVNGLDFVKAVRADPRFQDLKIVVVTTRTEPANVARALMAGVSELIQKPFTPEILRSKLRLIGVTV